MIGLMILKHSIRQVLGNFGMAVKVSAWFIVICMMIGIAAFMFLQVDVQQIAGGMTSFIADADQNPNIPGTFWFVALLFLIFVFWSASLIAVVWHRFVLLNEKPAGFIPFKNGLAIGRYFWTGVLIGILTILIAMVVMMIASIFISAFNSVAVASLILFIVTMFVTAFYLRLALVLPAIALNKKMTLGEAWRHGAGNFMTIFAAAIALALFQLAATWAIGQIATAIQSGAILALLNLAFQWFYFMLNISVLTTLYGHIVEKRDVF